MLLIRPDIFVTLGLQNQNTKIRDNAVYLDWRSDYSKYRSSELFKVIDHLLASQQKTPMAPGEAWNFYFPWNVPKLRSDYESPTSFIAFMRYSYYRPRDIVTLLRIIRDVNMRDPRNKERSQIDLADFEGAAVQNDYSNYLLGEVKDHVVFYYSMADYELFLKFFEFLSGSHQFSYKKYLQAFEKLEKHISTVAAIKPEFMATANDFLQFLFDLNVICYFESSRAGERFLRWCFREREYSNISPKVKAGMEYEVFYGLARALNVGKELR